jgi:muramoyltetrapeptide carboxypeptidase
MAARYGGFYERRQAGVVAMRIAVVAPSCTLDPTIPARLDPLAAAHGHSLTYHPQCFLSEGHFAGPDSARVAALVEVANDPAFDAVWFARGGYGACRVAEGALAQMDTAAARSKAYLGYSDAGFLLAGLYAQGIGKPVHAPMPSDLNRDGGAGAVERVLAWLSAPKRAEVPQVAFNLTVLSQLLGTPLQPDLTGHILMIEEVGEYMYRIDRSLFHLTSNPGVRRIKGLMLGRCSDIPPNNPDFVLDEEAITREWCARAGIAYLGRADIGHDIDNQIVAFGDCA